MGGRSKKKAAPIVPYQGDQIEIDFSSCSDRGASFDFSAFNQAELIGSAADDLESSMIRKKLGPKREDPTWGPVDEACVVPEQDHPIYIYTQRIYIGTDPILPMEYPPMNFKGMRGGLMNRSLSGIYIGPSYETKKNKRTLIHKASPLAGPYPFPFVKSVAKPFDQRRCWEINDYVKCWRTWWEDQGKHLPECQKELRILKGQLEMWGSLTLLHWCKPIDPLNEYEKRLLCPSTTIIEAIEELIAEDF